MSKETTIYSAQFDNLGELQTELENIVDAANGARKMRDGENEKVHPDEIDVFFGQVFLDEEELTDGSYVYNLRIA